MKDTAAHSTDYNTDKRSNECSIRNKFKMGEKVRGDEREKEGEKKKRERENRGKGRERVNAVRK